MWRALAFLHFILLPACFATTGLVTSVTGNYRVSGFADGLYQNALFSRPREMVMDTLNLVLYVADTDNKAVRSIDMNGNVSTLFTTRDSTWGLCLDPVNGGLYVSTWTQIIYFDMYTSQATVLYNSSTPINWTGLRYNPATQTLYMVQYWSSLFRWVNPLNSTTDDIEKIWTYSNSPSWDFEIDSVGNIYIGVGSQLIHVSPDGSSAVLAGSSFGYFDGTGINAQFSYVVAVAWNNAMDALYVADVYNNVIRQVLINDGTTTTVAGVQSTSHTSPFKPGTAETAKFATASEIYPHPMVPGYYFISDDFGIRVWYSAPPQLVDNSLLATYNAAQNTISVFWQLGVPAGCNDYYMLNATISSYRPQIFNFSERPPPFTFTPSYHAVYSISFTPYNTFGQGTAYYQKVSTR